VIAAAVEEVATCSQQWAALPLNESAAGARSGAALARVGASVARATVVAVAARDVDVAATKLRIPGTPATVVAVAVKLAASVAVLVRTAVAPAAEPSAGVTAWVAVHGVIPPVEGSLAAACRNKDPGRIGPVGADVVDAKRRVVARLFAAEPVDCLRVPAGTVAAADRERFERAEPVQEPVAEIRRPALSFAPKSSFVRPSG
jgi:hypothetical protein